MSALTPSPPAVLPPESPLRPPAPPAPPAARPGSASIPPGPRPDSAGEKQTPAAAGSILPAGIRHVAIIMDGNGRWAQNCGLPRIEGHRRGARSVRDIVRAAREIGLPALTLYAFSEQNWDRPLDEVSGLMQLLHDYVIEERAEIMDNGIRLRAIGNVARLPAFVRLPLEQLMADSAHHRDMDLCLALSYGGRESIADSIRAACARVRAAELRPQDIGEDTIAARLQTRELPPVDLVIRTSGERRVSNFLLWEAPRAAFCATPTPWPEFRRDDLFAVLRGLGPTRPRQAPPGPAPLRTAAPAPGLGAAGPSRG